MQLGSRVGAMGSGAAFAAWWMPADAAGPVAWVIHGVGTLVAGGVGYFLGSEGTTYIYELIVEEFKESLALYGRNAEKLEADHRPARADGFV